MALDNEIATKIPRNVLDYYSAKVLNQVTEGLVGFDPKTLKIEPRLASSWSKSDDSKTYTFTLRDDVYFHPCEVFANDNDRKMTASDVVKTFEMICTMKEDGTATHPYSTIFKSSVKGADDFFNKKEKSN